MMGYACNINGVYPLGKGEAVSSILTGSTIKSPFFAGFWRCDPSPYSAATGRTLRERAGATCGKSVYNVRATFRHPLTGTEGDRMMEETPAKGDYVLATKYNDGDPGDQWCVGFYDRLDGGRHYVVDGEGKQFRANGFRRVQKISAEVGARLVAKMPEIDGPPPSSLSIWDHWLPLSTP